MNKKQQNFNLRVVLFGFLLPSQMDLGTEVEQ